MPPRRLCTQQGQVRHHNQERRPLSRTRLTSSDHMAYYCVLNKRLEAVHAHPVAIRESTCLMSEINKETR